MVRGRLLTPAGGLNVVWFNRPYVKSQVDPEVEYLLHGVVRRRGESWELVNPSLEPVERARLAGRIVPVYPSAGKVPPSQIRRFLSEVFDMIDPNSIDDPVPADLLRRHRLPTLAQALGALHRPAIDADVDSLNAFRTSHHGRLIYGEALQLQVRLGLMRSRAVRITKEHTYRLDAATIGRLKNMLPFVMTDAQQRVLDEIVRDLCSPFPMMRLLQGDVGCGKTAVAALALAAAAESGLQGVLMAPTELLAEQHHEALARILGNRYRMALLTASAAGSADNRARLERGDVQLAIGTHALIQEGVRFSDLGLVIVDEQHRFGVEQRRRLQYKGRRPDLLVMTATPIPRSLTLTLYGDLSMSVIDELPPGRTPVETRLLSQTEREKVYSWLERELEEGARAYVVIPLIEESSRLQVESIEGLGQDLAERLQRFRPAILHGRTSSERRAEIMKAFSAGEVNVLISTTLIEVGVDVPEASIMIIESAERFGLSQLHQLRGRVGRGSRSSLCTAIYGRVSDDALQRLKVFAGTTDGFQIAEADLEIRGPGDVLGTRQSGMPAFRIINLVRDREWIEKARRDARETVESRPETAEKLASGVAAVAAYDRLAGA
jgi:ATP-dependent DNA helicase RecG